MSVTEGLDPTLIREISDRLRRAAEDASSVRATGDTLARELAPVWLGGDAEELLTRWSHLAPTLDRAAEALAHQAEGLRGQAEEQEEASSGGSSVPPAAPTAGLAPSLLPTKGVNAGLASVAALPVALAARAAAASADAASRWATDNGDKTNPPWDVNPETGTAVVSGRNVPNWEFAGRVYGGPGWTPETAETTGPEWTAELQATYPDGVAFTDAGFPLFYPYVHPDHPPVVIELTTSSSKDIRLAYEAAGISTEEAKELQRDWVWHHTHEYDPETGHGELILIPRDLHAAVKHAGGRSLYKHTGGETSD